MPGGNAGHRGGGGYGPKPYETQLGTAQMTAVSLV